MRLICELVVRNFETFCTRFACAPWLLKNINLEAIFRGLNVFKSIYKYFAPNVFALVIKNIYLRGDLIYVPDILKNPEAI